MLDPKILKYPFTEMPKARKSRRTPSRFAQGSASRFGIRWYGSELMLFAKNITFFTFSSPVGNVEIR